MAVSASRTPLGFLPRLPAGAAARSFRTQPQQGDFMGNGEGRRRRETPFPWPPSRSSSSTALRRLEDGGFRSSPPDCSSEKTLCERDEVTHWDYCFSFGESVGSVPTSLLVNSRKCFSTGGFIIVLLDKMDLKVIFFISIRKEMRMNSSQKRFLLFFLHCDFLYCQDLPPAAARCVVEKQVEAPKLPQHLFFLST